MKAIITVIDDNGEVICKDCVLGPVKENIVGTSDNFPIRETSLNFVYNFSVNRIKGAKYASNSITRTINIMFR